MVNEINRPTSAIENAAMRSRIEATNRAMRRMEVENERLVREMQELRVRAVELDEVATHQQQARDEQQQQQEANRRDSEIVNNEPPTSDITLEQAPPAEASAPEIRTPSETEIKALADLTATEPAECPRVPTATEPAKPAECPRVPTTIEPSQPAESPRLATTAADTSNPSDSILDAENAVGDHQDAVSEESIEYIRNKFAEIASLKAQFKRVQSLISTTSLIEDHLAGTHVDINDDDASTSSVSHTPPITEATLPEPPTVNGTAVPTFLEQTADAIHNENEELLTSVLDMFTVFNNDLRSQAEGLKAERERIRELKEKIIRNREAAREKE